MGEVRLFQDDDRQRYVRSHARCAGATERWFPEPEMGAPAREAKAECRKCPVQVDCLEIALERGEPSGIWGGKTTSERRSIMKKRRKEARDAAAKEA